MKTKTKIAAGICGLVSTVQALAQPSANVNSTFVAKNDGTQAIRAESMIRGMPFNLSAFMLYENFSGADIYRFRVHALPLKAEAGNASFTLGATAHAHGRTEAESTQEAGIATTFRYGNIGGMLRYFPSSNVLEMGIDAGSLDSVLAEIRGSHNIDTNNPNVRIGLVRRIAEINAAQLGLYIEGGVSGRNFEKRFYGAGIRAGF
ncbi:MAG: hypothetical protein ACMXX5_00165 [Candidatus Woesearchaeota archaeon]